MLYADAPWLQDSLLDTVDWLKDINDVLIRDEYSAFLVLKAVLQALRQALPPDALCQFSASLPVMIRGFLFENWNPNRHAAQADAQAFFEQIRFQLSRRGDIEPKLAVQAVFQALNKRLSENDLHATISCLQISSIFSRRTRLLNPVFN